MRRGTINLVVVIIAILIVIGVDKASAQIYFERHLIDNNANSFSLFVDDINGDNNNDIIVGGTHGKLLLYMGDGRGAFIKKTLGNNFGHVWSVYVSDVNRDGKKDILAVSTNLGYVAWWKNRGNGRFTKYMIDDNLTSAENVKTGDFDNDGDIDLVAVGWGQSTPAPVYWYENRGDENFLRRELDPDFLSAHTIAIADLNKDGKVDIAGASASERSVVWWENRGNGSFRSHNIATKLWGAFSVKCIDVDQNGTNDLLCAAHAGGARKIVWWRNDGAGRFSSRLIDDSFANNGKVFAADIDGDYDIDIISASATDGQVAFWQNNGNEQFGFHVLDNIDAAGDIFAASINRDGMLDIVLLAGGGVYWYENKTTEEIIMAPNAPNGPVEAILGENLVYSAFGASSSFGHALEYQYDWGDGSFSSWGDSVQEHRFRALGTFEIRVKARCKIHNDKVSAWSEKMSVKIRNSIHYVSGNVRYYNNDNPISNAEVIFSGDFDGQVKTDLSGKFNVSVNDNSSVRFEANKSKGEEVNDVTVSMYDAAKTAQAALGLITLNQSQLVAADADENGYIQSFDAALIAQFAVGLNFIHSSKVGSWVFFPKQRVIDNIERDETDQNFTGIVVGDVDGNWASRSYFEEKKPFNDTEKYSIKIVEKKNVYELNFMLNKPFEIISCDIRIEYSKYFVFDKIEKTDLSNEFNVIVNKSDEMVSVGLYSIKNKLCKGNFVKIRFKSENQSLSKLLKIKLFQINQFVLSKDITLINDSMGIFQIK